MPRWPQQQLNVNSIFLCSQSGIWGGTGNSWYRNRFSQLFLCCIFFYNQYLLNLISLSIKTMNNHEKKKLYNYCISLYYIIEFDGQLKSTFAYFSGFWSRAPVCVSVQTAPFPVYLLDSNRAVADFWIRLVSFSPQVWLMIISIFNVFFSSQCHPSLGLSLKWSFS